MGLMLLTPLSLSIPRRALSKLPCIPYLLALLPGHPGPPSHAAQQLKPKPVEHGSLLTALAIQEGEDALLGCLVVLLHIVGHVAVDRVLSGKMEQPEFSC